MNNNLVNSSNKFCNEFYPKNENYMFNANINISNSNNTFSECRHCVHKNSPKCLHSQFQAPSFDILG